MLNTTRSLPLLVVLAFSGCTSDAPDPAKPPAVPAKAAASSKPAAAAPEEAAPDPRPDGVLRLGLPPYLDQSKVATEMQAMVDYLDKATGLRTELKVTRSYFELLDGLVKGSVDVARLSSVLLLQAQAKVPGGVELFAHTKHGGSKRYSGFIIAKADAPYQSLKDLKTKRFAFVDRWSASGYVFPRLLLKSEGVDPDEDFSSVQFSGSHDKVFQAVLRGDVDAGAIWDAAYKTAPPMQVAKVQVLAQTEPIPPDAIVQRAALPADLKAKVSGAFLAIAKLPADQKKPLQGALGLDEIMAADPSVYDELKKTLEELGELPSGPAKK